MPEKQEKKPLNFWLAGKKPLLDLPEIGNGLAVLAHKDKNLREIYRKNGILPWKAQPGGFRGLMRVILAQQISTAVASHLVLRLESLAPEMTPDSFLRLREKPLREIGLSRQKIAYGRALAEDILKGNFRPAKLRSMDDATAHAALTSLKGIGPWSAEIYMMFSMGRGDVWPAGDIGLQKGLQRLLALGQKPDADTTREIGRRWVPHRTAAALILWQA